MEAKIKSIEKGWGEDSTFFTTNPKASKPHKVDRIVCVERTVGKGYYNDLTLDSYIGYIGDKIIFEIEANSQLTIIHE